MLVATTCVDLAAEERTPLPRGFRVVRECPLRLRRGTIVQKGHGCGQAFAKGVMGHTKEPRIATTTHYKATYSSN